MLEEGRASGNTVAWLTRIKALVPDKKGGDKDLVIFVGTRAGSESLDPAEAQGVDT